MVRAQPQRNPHLERYRPILPGHTSGGDLRLSERSVLRCGSSRVHGVCFHNEAPEETGAPDTYAAFSGPHPCLQSRLKRCLDVARHRIRRWDSLIAAKPPRSTGRSSSNFGRGLTGLSNGIGVCFCSECSAGHVSFHRAVRDAWFHLQPLSASSVSAAKAGIEAPILGRHIEVSAL
jgi:hypothetical protein